MSKNEFFVDMTHSCGDRFRIPVARRDLGKLTFTCPQCGKTERFTRDQISKIEATVGDRLGLRSKT